MTASNPDSAGQGDLYPPGPSADEMAEQEAILAEEIAAGVFQPPPGDEIDRMWLTRTLARRKATIGGWARWRARSVTRS